MAPNWLQMLKPIANEQEQEEWLEVVDYTGVDNKKRIPDYLHLQPLPSSAVCLDVSPHDKPPCALIYSLHWYTFAWLYFLRHSPCVQHSITHQLVEGNPRSLCHDHQPIPTQVLCVSCHLWYGCEQLWQKSQESYLAVKLLDPIYNRCMFESSIGSASQREHCNIFQDALPILFLHHISFYSSEPLCLHQNPPDGSCSD